MTGDLSMSNMENQQNQSGKPIGEFIGIKTGVVKHWAMDSKTKERKAFGFITPDDVGIGDVFIHYTQIEPWRKGFKELRPGEVVKFELYRTSRGLQAFNVLIKRSVASTIEDQEAQERWNNI